MPESWPEATVGPSLREAAGFWWKLGWISFGGTAAHIAIMQAELVERRRWIDSDEFFHALSHCMLLPGPEAQQLAIYIGWRLNGARGGVLAGTLFVLPSTVILLGLSLLYAGYGTTEWLSSVFHVLKPVVVALVLRALYQVGRRALKTRLQWFTAGVSFLAITLLRAPVPWMMGMIVATGGVIGILTRMVKADWPSRAKKNAFPVRAELARVARITAGCIAIGCLPIAVLAMVGHDFRFWVSLSAFFTKTAFVTIGGSYTVLPYVAQVAVSNFSWLSHTQMLDGFALAETTPGPLIIVVGFVGFMAGLHHFEGSSLMGAISLLITIFYTFLPCFLFVLLGAPWIAKSGESPLFKALLRLITAVVVAAILQLTVFLVRGVLFANGWRSLDIGALTLILGSLLLIQLLARRSRMGSKVDLTRF
jgi:chromate transporter